MRYSIPVKFLAFVLAAVALTAAFVSVLGIIQVAELGLYSDGFDSWVQNRLQWQAYDLAKDLTDRYAVRSLTNCPDEVLEDIGYFYVFEESFHWTGLDESSYDFTITDEQGQVLASGAGLTGLEDTYSFQTAVSIRYPVLVTNEALIDERYGTNYTHRETVYPAAYNGKAAIIRYYESPEYAVDIKLDPDAAMDRSGSSLELIQLVYVHRYNLMIVLAISLVLFAAATVYLCCAAGKEKPGDTPNPRGLNRLPLDLYAAAGSAGGMLLASLVSEMINYWIFSMDNLNAGTLVLVGAVLLGIAVIIMGFVFALSAQVKGKGLFWWKHSVIGWLWSKLWIGIQYLYRGVKMLLSLLPVMWHYVLIGGLMGFSVVVAMVFAFNSSLLPLLVVIPVYALVVIYGGYAYGVLLRGAEKMAKGDLNARIDKRFLVGAYAKCADDLNALADVAIQAAKKQMRSERMKTELITNVSHDIKTPLTSIINYVDLLQSAQDKDTAGQYLEVLGRQSQRLKKLIEDLMEMSKATTGNMSVDIARVDPVEAVNQALGEFSDKLTAGELTVVFRQPEKQLAMYADGRLTWRVLSNLLSNTVKYALPGTRVYADVTELENQVLISLKNISREALNVTADELTERFVRGDASRNTEGSGLGLNIAKSLMELQKGQLQLLVDGDLFKVTLVFPKAQ